uniref:Chemokine interleukin-8-like domain-containing protein n=1 Tax=Oryzias melastigma TaxID=30732 RepID=A0A3B3CIC1_ORYME
MQFTCQNYFKVVVLFSLPTSWVHVVISFNQPRTLWCVAFCSLQDQDKNFLIACCFTFYQKKIPADAVQSFRDTDEQYCIKNDMTNNKDICVDPSSEWVKKLMNVLQ